MISVNPIKKNLRPKKVEHNGNYYTLEETERLIRLVKGEGVEFPVLMAAFYGLRRSEIMGLRWQAIDFRGNTITISRTVVQTRVDGKTAVVEKDRAKNKRGKPRSGPKLQGGLKSPGQQLRVAGQHRKRTLRRTSMTGRRSLIWISIRWTAT